LEEGPLEAVGACDHEQRETDPVVVPMEEVTVVASQMLVRDLAVACMVCRPYERRPTWVAHEVQWVQHCRETAEELAGE